MIITKTKLAQIISEELQLIQQEDIIFENLSNLVELEAKKIGFTLTEAEKKSLIDLIRKNLGAIGMGSALALGSAGLHSMQSDYQQGIQQAMAQNVEKAEKLAATPEYQASKIKQQLDNKNRFIWTISDNPNDQTPYPAVERTENGFQYVEFNPAKIILQNKKVAAVLPPEWSVLKQVYDDVQAGTGPRVQASDVVAAQGGPNKKGFFQDDAWQNANLKGWGVGRPYSGALYMDYESIPDNYAMPLSGKSPSELYVEYWNDFVTNSK